MMATREWDFEKAQDEAEDRGMHVLGLYGYAPNFGDTEEAMIEILTDFKKVRTYPLMCLLYVHYTFVNFLTFAKSFSSLQYMKAVVTIRHILM